MEKEMKAFCLKGNIAGFENLFTGRDVSWLVSCLKTVHLCEGNTVKHLGLGFVPKHNFSPKTELAYSSAVYMKVHQ